jgi:hypothetical protein
MTDVVILKTIFVYAVYVLAVAIIPTLMGLWFLRRRIREHRHVRNLMRPEQRELPLKMGVSEAVGGRR